MRIFELERFLLCHSFLRLKLLKLLFQNHVFFKKIPTFIADTVAVIPNRAKIFFDNGAATFVNGPLYYLTTHLKNHQFELF